jgi:hypothetical protein
MFLHISQTIPLHHKIFLAYSYLLKTPLPKCLANYL